MRMPEGTMDAAEFRRCMRGVTGAVGVITCGEDGARTGLTATAICSLTDSPPMLLACVNQQASAHPIICRHGRFAVNILSADHLPVAQRFAGQGGAGGEQRFEHPGWIRQGEGAPMLRGAIASFDCVLEAEYKHGSHSIFVGKVLSATSSDGARPLLYHAGCFGTFGEAAAPA
jgi:flavin reductase